MKFLTSVNVMFGADPEFFFSKNGRIVGAEKVIPKDGVSIEMDSYTIKDGVKRAVNKAIIIDGVQGELNIAPAVCRQLFAASLKKCFLALKEQLKKGGFKANFSQTVDISKRELSQLSPATQQFGCSPSKNSYKKEEISVKDASKYYKRSAGGHIHLGHEDSDLVKALLADANTVPLLDIIVGNTCVLLDRDPGNAERRKVYGKAGEYRLPAHGLEYRTLSNFWLRSYQLTSFVLAMCRFALTVAQDKELVKEIMAAVDIEDVKNAINNNDFKLAYQNFNKIKLLLSQITDSRHGLGSYPLEGERLRQFEFVVKKGVDYWFSENVINNWTSPKEGLEYGWERFLRLKVAPKMERKTAKMPQNLELAINLVTS
jgi:hypothetical protein